MHLGISVVQLLILFIFNFKNTRVVNRFFSHLYQIYAAFVSLASPHPTMTSLICATVRNEYTNSLRNDVSNLFVNTHVRVKIYREFYHCIIFIANEGRHVRIIYNLHLPIYRRHHWYHFYKLCLNKCFVDLTLGRNDINDVVGRWGDVSYV
jgi:hypothetical protein